MIYIYHHNDLDGRCAAAIAVKACRPAATKCIEMSYTREPPMPDKGEVVVAYILDFSFNPEQMEALRKVVPRVVWIDHHKSAKDYPYQELAGLRDFADKGLAGCELAWRYFYPREAMPRAVSLIGDYDAWRHQEEDCVPFFEGMKTKADSPTSDIWRTLLGPSSEGTVEDTIKDGRACIKYRDNYTAEMRKSYQYNTTLGGHKARALNLTGFGKAAFGRLEDVKDVPLCIAYSHDGRKFSVSLYSELKDVDCATIAKKYGGGGHRGAAGFTCEELPFKLE